MNSVLSGGARRVLVRTAVAATLALAPVAVILPSASAVPCRLPTDIGCTNPDGTLGTGQHNGHHHRPGGGLDDDRYGADGFDVFGYDRSGYNRFGYDRWGYDRSGFDRDGYTAKGCARNGADRADADRAVCDAWRHRPSTGSAAR